MTVLLGLNKQLWCNPTSPTAHTHTRTCVLCMCADNSWEFHWWPLRTTLLCSSDCRLNCQWKTAFKTSVLLCINLNRRYFEHEKIQSWILLIQTRVPPTPFCMSVFPPVLVNLPPPPAPSEVTWFSLHQQLKFPLRGLFMDSFSDTGISVNAFKEIAYIYIVYHLIFCFNCNIRDNYCLFLYLYLYILLYCTVVYYSGGNLAFCGVRAI